jgi:hypothetical protein
LRRGLLGGDHGGHSGQAQERGEGQQIGATWWDYTPACLGALTFASIALRSALAKNDECKGGGATCDAAKYSSAQSRPLTPGHQAASFLPLVCVAR